MIKQLYIEIYTLFKNLYTKKTNSTYKKWLNSLSDIKKEFSNTFAVNNIFTRLENKILNTNIEVLIEQEKINIKENVPLKIFLYEEIINSLFHYIGESGTHIYRGILSPYGHELHNIFLQSVNFLAKEKIYTKEEIKQLKEDMIVHIQQWG